MMMRRLWLLFAQTATVGLALWLVLAATRPELLAGLGVGPGPHVPVVAVGDAPPPVAGQASYREAARRAMPAVVNIFTSKEARRPRNPMLEDPFFRRFFGERFNEEQRQSSLGSGVVVSADGYILTNNHVVEAADEIEVALADGRKAAARVVGTDPDTDLAVIKVNLKNLPAITFGRSEQAGVGDVVLAIGNPFGVGQTVTLGIVSAIGRSHLGINAFENFIQTDAAINPGNSGGALVDASGALIGINSAIYSNGGGSLGIGFAIPAATAKTVMEAILRSGSVVRGWIGVETQDITPELADSFGLRQANGVIIAGVLRGGPAAQAGIRPGDILLEVGGKVVADSTAMLNLVAQLKPGDSVGFRVLRKGQEETLEVTVGKRPKARRD